MPMNFIESLIRAATPIDDPRWIGPPLWDWAPPPEGIGERPRRSPQADARRFPEILRSILLQDQPYQGASGLDALELLVRQNMGGRGGLGTMDPSSLGSQIRALFNPDQAGRLQEIAARFNRPQTAVSGGLAGVGGNQFNPFLSGLLSTSPTFTVKMPRFGDQPRTNQPKGQAVPPLQPPKTLAR